MFLKSLEIHGFKSFPDRTKLEFSDGITAVVGPNGSGKSNISDAVRWVLGEQSSKTLRGSKMEDVIFSGTQLRKPQGFAEVSLTIDNSTGFLNIDSDTVTITRKYYRSGESEYLLNGSQVRLRDINELLMDTGLGRDGYAMVEQGKVAEIVSAKSTERREIFEEAAGISKFRYRKEESERRLKMAEENLLRLLDIARELEERLDPLKRQSEKAKQYLDYAEQKRSLELSYWVHMLEQLTSRLRSQDDNLTIANGENEELERKITDADDALQEIFRSMQGCMTLAEQLRGEKRELEQKNADVAAQIAVVKNDISHNLESVERIREEIETLRQSDREILAQIGQRERSIAEKSRIIAALDQQTETLEQKLNSAAEKTTTFNRQADALRQKLAGIALEKTEFTLTADVTRRRITEIDESLNGDRAVLEKQEAELSAALEEQRLRNEDEADCAGKFTSLENAVSGYRMKQTSRHGKLDKITEELAGLEAKIRENEQRSRLLQDLEQNMEGFSGSAKAVLRAGESGRLRGIRGSVAQLISTEGRYSVAVEIALGGALQNIVVEREDNAKAAVAFLKEQKAGRATFLPLTSVRGKLLDEPGLSGEEGYVALASELVACAAEYEGIVRWLLGRTAVAEDIDAAIDIAKKYRYRFRIVTLDGQVVNAGGSITGGFVARSQGILSRKNDISRLQEQIKSLRKDAAALGESRNALLAETAELDAQVEAIQSEMRSLSEDRIRLESEQKRLSALTEAYGARIAALKNRISLSEEQKQSAESALAEAETRLKTLEKNEKSTAGELSALEGSNSELLDEFNAVTAEISTARIQKVELQKEIEALKEFIASLEGRKTDSAQAVESLEGRIVSLGQENGALEEKIAALEKEADERIGTIDGIDRRVAEALSQREQFEAKSVRVREEQRHITERRESIIRSVAHLEEQKLATQKEYDGIIGQMWNEYEMTRSQAEQLAEPVEDFSALQRNLNAVRGKIRSLGTVNLAAIDEYKEVRERHELLTEQIRDVETSRSELDRLIDELTENMKEMFADSFRKISRNFSRIFSDLFGGGKGELVLTDPDNLLETGIEINVQPPGKVIKNLASLSGGEQAFVAIAVYFAILNVHPAPFCILDEIEAALDDVNVSKYARYLRSYSDNTQFILITHRRGTMEEADVLYGVTMQQEGVSKLLELNVGEVEAAVGKLS